MAFIVIFIFYGSYLVVCASVLYILFLTQIIEIIYNIFKDYIRIRLLAFAKDCKMPFPSKIR